MQLVYIWIKDFKIIKEQGFNFSSNWEIQYDKEANNLSINRKEPLPTDFFGTNVINTSAVVGENGAGKSTLFEFLLGHYFTPYEYLYHDIIAVWDFVNDGEPSLVVHRSNQLSEGVFTTPEVEGYQIINEIFNPEEELEKLEIHTRERHPINTFDKIFYSNSIDQRYFYFKGFNISSLYLMRGGELDITQADDLLIENTNHNLFQVHFVKDLKRQLDYLRTNPDLPFSSPKVLYLFPTQLNLSDLFRYEIGEDAKRQINQFGLRLEYSPDFNPEHSHLRNIQIDYYESLFAIALRRYIKAKNNDDLDIPSYISSFFGDGVNTIEKLTEEFNEEERVFIIEILEFTSTLQVFYGHSQRRENSWVIENDKWEQFYDILNRNQNIFLDCFSISWDLPSSGEIAFLKLFSRLFSLTEKLNNFNRSVYLFLDEGEIGFHPQWQKRYLKYVLDFINNSFDRKFQLFITTHSPFLVSDLPSGNVVFLKKEDDKCEVVQDDDEIPITFGANIHVLLSDSFFLQGGLIGEFANDKIQEVINWINEDNEPSEGERNEKLRLIEKIGEPLIRIKLLEMYQEKFGIPHELRIIDEQIKILEEKKRNIKNQENDD